jgi:hypothetical protein
VVFQHGYWGLYLFTVRKINKLLPLEKSLGPGRNLWINNQSDGIWIRDTDYGM